MTTSFRRVTATVIAPDQGGIVRKVQGFAFEAAPPAGVVRKLQGFAFESIKKALPLTVTGDLALYGLINNNSYYTSWSASNSTLGTPVADTSKPNANTRVNLAAKVASGYSGNINLYYNRQPFSSLTSASISLGTIAADTTVWALLATINSKYSCNLTQQDVVNGTVKAGALSVLLTAAAGSWLFQPGTQVLVGQQIALSAATPVTALSGFASATGVGPVASVALLHFDGANGSTTFTDQTGSIWTANGGEAISTTSAKFGTGAFYNGGTANKNITTPDAAKLKLTGDFTVEFFLNSASVSASQILTTKGSGGRLILSGGAIFAYDDTGGNQISGGTIVAGSYYHIALVKKGTTTTLYVNGTAVGSNTTFGTFGNNTSALYIGTYYDGTYPMNGYIDEYRISNLARYVANFTPPAAAFAVD